MTTTDQLKSGSSKVPHVAVKAHSCTRETYRTAT
jgi:hypothetical protein